jgi:integrase
MCQKIYEEHAEHSVSLANHCLAIYRVLFNYAIRHGYTTFNPFSKVLRRADKPRRTVWAREDVRAFLNVAYSEFKWRNVGLIAQMAYEYGQRMGDMRMLRWEQVDLDKGVLHLEQSKRRARVSIPTSAGLLTMLRQQKEEFGWQKYVAPSNKADRKGGLLPYSLFNLSKVAKQIMIEAQLPDDLRLQDLRRTAVTEMIEVGVPLPNVMAVTGHATPQSLTPYIKNTLRSATVASQMRGLL